RTRGQGAGDFRGRRFALSPHRSAAGARRDTGRGGSGPGKAHGTERSRGKGGAQRRLRYGMEQRTEELLSPYSTFSRAQWAALRADTPMTLTPEEVTRVRSLHDRLDMKEVEEIYLPLSRLLSMYVEATQRLFVAQQRFL